MINFSAIPKDSLIGKFLRRILKFIPKNAVLPVLQGKLRGKKWIIGSGVFGYWLGTYELEKQKLFQKTVGPGDVVYDIGAHAGFYALLASILVGEKGKVFAFEPLPQNIFFLKKHVEMNNCRNVQIMEMAVSEKSGRGNFEKSADSFSGQLSDGSGLQIEIASLDDLIKNRKLLPPTVLKIDAEGAELKILKGARSLLKIYRPIVILATHSSELHKDCLNLLKEEFNYALSPIIGNDISKTSEIIAFSEKI